MLEVVQWTAPLDRDRRTPGLLLLRGERMTRTLCARCGVSPKVPGRGKRYCSACYEWRDSTLRDRNIEYLRRYREDGRDKSKSGQTRRKNRDAPEGTRWCPRCSQYLRLNQFNKSGSYCKGCAKSSGWILNLRKKFGLTDVEYYTLLDSQGGACAICRMVPKKQNLAVDHDHKTGVIRGLLCSTCNHQMLGGAKDDVEILRRAVAYLDEPPAPGVIGERSVPE